MGEPTTRPAPMVQYKELEFPFKNSWNKHYRVIGSCNGLICLYDDMFTYCGTMFLWNPSIRKVLQLPPFRVRFNTHGPYGHTFGFGFDPVTDDYKVVRIVYLDREMDPPEDPPEVDVYSLNNGTWRNISHSVNLSYEIFERSSSVYLHGAAHWVAVHWVSVEPRRVFHLLIVSFSMSDEVFREMKLPEIVAAHEKPYRVNIVNFHGSLAIVQYSPYSGRKNYCLWVRKEYGVAESWTKQFNIDIDLVGELFCFPSFRRKNEVLVSTKGVPLELYDPTTEQFKDVGIRFPTKVEHLHSFYLYTFEERLVLLGVRDTLASKVK